MMPLIAAALAAAAPATPTQIPADAHAQHQQMAPGQGHEQHQMADMGKDCCCKDMKDKMHSDHDMDGMQHHQEHGGR